MAGPVLASVVVLPEQNGEDTSTPTGSKRRRSSAASSNDSKRPRLDVTDSTVTIAGTTAPPRPTTDDLATLPPNTSSPVSDSQRRQPPPSRTDKDEERRRGKRLFGGLLGTLSQSANSRTNKRKEEVEKKQAEKLKQLDEEQEAARRLQKEELDALRRGQQRVWDEKSAGLRHENSRAMARFLKTDTQPSLFYKPWDLLPRQEEKIKIQIAEIDKHVVDELEKLETQSNDNKPEKMKDSVQQGETDEVEGEKLDTVGSNQDIRTETPPAMADASDMAEPETDNTTTEATIEDGAAAEAKTVEVTSAAEAEPQHERAEDNEEMVVTGEDAVIY